MKSRIDIATNIFVIVAIIVIVVLKCINVITISWLWLLSPIWIGFGLGILFCTFVTIIYLFRKIINKGE